MKTPPVLYRRDNLRERATAILMAELQPKPDWMTPSVRKRIERCVLCDCGSFDGDVCPTPMACWQPEGSVEQSPHWRLICILISVAIVVGIGVALVRYFVGVNS